jgi:hypothetical protein
MRSAFNVRPATNMITGLSLSQVMSISESSAASAWFTPSATQQSHRAVLVSTFMVCPFLYFGSYIFGLMFWCLYCASYVLLPLFAMPSGVRD